MFDMRLWSGLRERPTNFFTTNSSSNGSLLPDSFNFSEYFVVHFLLFDYFLRGLFEEVDSILHFLLSVCKNFFHLNREKLTLRR